MNSKHLEDRKRLRNRLRPLSQYDGLVELDIGGYFIALDAGADSGRLKLSESTIEKMEELGVDYP